MIRINHLTKIYGNEKNRVEALKDIDFHLKEGGFTAIMGPSGSGKSTLMNIIGCLDSQTYGTYQLNGIDIKKLNSSKKAELRNKFIGFIFQSFYLLPRLTAEENIELPLIYKGESRIVRMQKVENALRMVGLSHRAKHLPSELSGGQRQRVAIARALINDPKLILADEPTGNLDSATGKEIMEVLKDLHRQGATILLITHEQKIAQYASEIKRLQDGVLYDG